jgi:hypothetical protein
LKHNFFSLADRHRTGKWFNLIRNLKLS